MRATDSQPVLHVCAKGLSTIPPTSRVAVTPSETLAGNFSHPARSATKTLQPMKIGISAGAGLIGRRLRWLCRR